MSDQTAKGLPGSEMLAAMFEAPQKLFAQFTGQPGSGDPGGDMAQWTAVAQQLQAQWLTFQREQAQAAGGAADAFAKAPDILGGLGQFVPVMQDWLKALPLGEPARQKQFWEESLSLWQGVLGQYGIGPQAGEAAQDGPALPRKDRRFADPKWREQPFHALVHQTYLMLAEQVQALAESAGAESAGTDSAGGGDQARSEQLKFAARTLTEMLSPAHFPLTNPVVLEKTIASKGENLIKGMQHLLSDLKRGQLTHVDPAAFKVGENIAATPGKVVHETSLYQLIQYSPTTPNALEVPLLIFPPWINRFYILDLSPEKSFIRWAVEQGLSVFVVSWKSADESMRDLVWDDYIRAQIDAIDHVRSRLDVNSVHTIGYCVAGTTLAATLALLARRGEAGKVKSATFFTAQVDFELSGELKVFIDDQQLAALEKLSAKQGYLDGRYMAFTFNMLRGNDLIWNYVIKNYLLGEDYPAFDLLHWNGDVTNLPAKWHMAYLKDLYRDNKLVVPDCLSADGTPIDLTRIEVPTYIQAGREDHIAPAASVWKLMDHLRGDKTFLLAGSGHIAGVVNPPSARKYQYWTNPGAAESLDQFVAGAIETPGSWWPHWIEWIRSQDAAEVPVNGKRVPGAKGDSVIEDAPGRYVKSN
ncbi:MAG: alpha/beta fold hydrolase [Novosphingobium sp.]|uniref:PHA/PHB synthase family protein n=1 Tax=Novosphingobium sp. TaxID=1874826 RepID=UPI0032BC040B